MTGTYLLEIFLRDAMVIRIGKLGSFFFDKGYYVYVGSAKRNFRQRIDRHFRKEKRVYWHIDYLLRFARVLSVWSCPLGEEQTAAILAHEMSCPAPRFGASDKRSESHLFGGELDKNIPELNLTRIR